MKNFLSKNWFKLSVAIAILIVAISIGCYLVSNAFKSTQTMNSEEVLSNQQKCADQSSKAYVEEGYGSENKSGDATSYIDHYNQKLNQCFIEIYDHNLDAFTISLIDAYELKEYDSYLYLNSGNGGAENPQCNLDEQIMPVSARTNDCSSQSEFEQYIQPFMEN